jgi:Plavaka transposase
MPPTRCSSTRTAHSLAPPRVPTFACPYCPRHLYSRIGRTKHIRHHHEPQYNLPLSPSPAPLPLQLSSELPSPIHSNSVISSSRSNPEVLPPFNQALPPEAHGTTPSPLHDEPLFPDYNHPSPTYHGDVNSPTPDSGAGHIRFSSAPPEDDFEHANDDEMPVGATQVPGSRVMRTYHPTLNGKPISSMPDVTMLNWSRTGQVCDQDGFDVPLDTPPPPRDSDRGPDDWTPYDNRLQFEVANFLYRRNQMSAGNINILLGLWAASLVIHDDEPPFSSASDLYDTIDSTPLGDVAWQSFSLRYNCPPDVSNPLPWMTAEYDVWFRDPRTLVHNLLANPDFKSGFDYAPYQEHMPDGVHRFGDFMSGNWAWNQAVRHPCSLCGLILISWPPGYHCRGSTNPWRGLLSHHSRE